MTCFTSLLRVKACLNVLFSFECLCGSAHVCGTLLYKTSLKLRGERRLRVFKYRVLGRIFGPRRDEVTGAWRELHIMRSVMICTPQLALFG
jgi:hypothetical protein